MESWACPRHDYRATVQTVEHGASQDGQPSTQGALNLFLSLHQIYLRLTLHLLGHKGTNRGLSILESRNSFRLFLDTFFIIKKK